MKYLLIEVDNLVKLTIIERMFLYKGGVEENSVPPDLPESLAQIHNEFTGITHTDPDILDDESLMDAVIKVEHIRRSLDAVSVRLVAALDARGSTDRDHGLRTAPWLARQANLPSSTASARVKVARKLGTVLLNVGEALADGQIAWDHAKVLADAANPRIADDLDQIAPFIISGIGDAPFNRWKRDVEALADLIDQDGGHDPSNDIERNRLRLSPTGNSLAISGELSGENALIAREALDTIADELFHQFKKDSELTSDVEIPCRSTLLALALVEAVRRGLCGKNGRAPRPEATLHLSGDRPDAGTTDNAPPDVHASGGGGQAAGAPDAAAANRDGPLNYRPTQEMHRHAPVYPIPSTLTELIQRFTSIRQDRWRGLVVSDGDGTYLPRSAWQTLLCDPDLYTVVTDSLGVPIDMGRRVRFATRAQRRALAARDGGCVFPGCESRPEWTDAHHARPWERDGHTNVGDLASLCRHHHGLAHRNGWNLEVNSDGTTTWTTPSGQRFAGQQHQRVTGEPLEPDHGIQIPDTA